MWKAQRRAAITGLIAVGIASALAGAAEARHEAPQPLSVVALGDSITAGWGASGTPQIDPSASWATGSEAAVDSHVARLTRRDSSPLVVANLASPGKRMVLRGGELPAQAAWVQAGTDLALIGAGSADLCLGSVTTPALMTSPVRFEQGFTALLYGLMLRTPDIRVFVSSIPDWYGLWERHQGDPQLAARWQTPGTCPLLFGSTATAATRAAVRDRTSVYNAILEQVCARFAGCRYDGGAAHGVDLAAADLSSYDGFHPSLAGQAKLAAATWAVAAGWYGTSPVRPRPRYRAAAVRAGARLASGGGRHRIRYGQSVRLALRNAAGEPGRRQTYRACYQHGRHPVCTTRTLRGSSWDAWRIRIAGSWVPCRTHRIRAWWTVQGRRVAARTVWVSGCP